MPKPRIRRRVPSGRMLDTRRLLASLEFLKETETAIAQAAKHGNTNPLYEIFARFERTQHFRGLVVYFGERTGFLPEFEYGKVKLTRRIKAKDTAPSLSACLEQHEGSITDVLGSQARMAPMPHVDALTPGIRLPGSYETGPRR